MEQSAIGVGMIGCGTVGAGVATLLAQEAGCYRQRLGRPIELRKVLVRSPQKLAGNQYLPPETITADPEDFFNTPDMPIVIEAAGGRGVISEHVRRAIAMGKHIVTANKSLLAAEGPELFALSRKHGVSIAFEASCGGGIPIITAIKFGLMANRITALYGILNGTCNYILTEMTQQGKTYEVALAEAQAYGYAEADPTLDVSGQDAGQKLAILASLAFGVCATGDQVDCVGIDGLSLEDIRYGAELGYDIKLLAIAEQKPVGLDLRVRPCFVHREEPLAQVYGSFNALSVYGHAVGHTMYFGRGAGQMPTASAVVSDLLNVASGWYPASVRSMNLLPDRHQAVTLADPGELASRFYMRMKTVDVPGVLAKITTILGQVGISISGVVQHESEPGQSVSVVILTHVTRQGAVDQAIENISALDVVHGPPVVLRILDLPEG